MSSLSSLADGLRLLARLSEAHTAISRALVLSKQSGLTRSNIHAVALAVAGSIASDDKRLNEAREFDAEALALANALSYESLATMIRLNLAEVEFESGNTKRALELTSAIRARSSGSNLFSTYNSVMSYALNNSAAYQIVLDDIAGARADAERLFRSRVEQSAMPR